MRCKSLFTPTWIALLLALWTHPGNGQAQGFGFNERGPRLGEQIDTRPVAAPSPAATEATDTPVPAGRERRSSQGFSRKQSYRYEEDLFAEGLMLPVD